MDKNIKILIVTGIYPPEIGGPAEYAKNLKEIWTAEGYKVSVKIFGQFKKITWGIRHIIFFFYILPRVARTDYIFALDAFSAGVVTLAAKMFSKKIIFRTGGDALWELYVERTGDLVLLKDFYKKRSKDLSWKESVMFHLIKWTLQNLSAIIWSTEWQKDIFMEPYDLSRQKHFIVENYYGPKLHSEQPTEKNFLASTRKIKWKNLNLLEKVFQRGDVVASGANLDMKALPHDEFLSKISYSYAIIIVSLGDISPNTILDAIRYDKPFIVTRETGLYERIKDIAVFVDPKDQNDIAQKVIWLSNPVNYEEQQNRVKSFNFKHNWEDIAKEYITIYDSLR